MARKDRFIVNKFGQQHSYDSLVTILQDLSPQDIKDVLLILGLDEIVDTDGGLVPAYSADIISSEERFLNPSTSHNITLTGKLYNYYQDASDKATSWKWTRDSDSSDTDAQWVKTTREIVLTDADLTTKIQSQKVFFHLEVKIGEETFTDVIDFSTVVTLNAVQIKQSHGLFIGGDPTEITMTAQTQGLSADSYKWYVNDALKATTRIYKLPSSIIPNGQVANVRLEVIDVKGYTYSDFVSIPKLSNGTKGEPGVPGPPGEDGTPKYTWIKYADDDQGTNMSEYPTKPDGTFREWMGIGSNKDTPIESNQYTDYMWSKYIGEDGIPGENGYMWVVYSQYPKGLDHTNKVDVHNDPYDEVAEEYMVYLGLAYNKAEKTEPNFNAMTPAVFEQQGFYWSKIRGEDGHTGYVLDSDNNIIALPADSEGNIIGTLSGNVAKFRLFYGNDQIDLSTMYVEFTQTGGVTFESSSGNTGTLGMEDWITVTDITSDTGAVTMSVYSDSEANKVLAETSVQVAKFKNTPVFNIVTSVSAISVIPGSTVGDLPIITPNKLEVKVMKNTGYEVMETSEGTLTYKYNFQSGDGQAIEPDASGKYTINISNAGNPKHIELQYFHPIVSNKVADRETVPFVRDGTPGAPGQDGEDGAPGEQGPPGVPGSRGPMARMLEWREGYTYYRSAEYRDYIYYRSDNTTYEGWYCVRKAPANLYNTTAEGVKEYRAVANSGSPDTAKFQKQDFTDSQVFGTIIAENANLAGFIFRNQKLYSQLGLDTENAEPQFSNLMLNGSQGYMQFAKNFLLQKEGIYQKDVTATSENKNRLALEFVQGTPRIRMWHPNGVLGIEMGIIEGVLTLNFYDSEGNLVYKLGQTGIIYVDRVAASYTPSSYVEFTSASYSDDEALKTEFLYRAKATRISTVNEGPENKYVLYECASVPNITLLSYNAGKNENSENNKQYESLLFLQQGTSLDNPATKARFTGVLTSTKIGDTVFHGTWSDGVHSESNTSGYLYYNTVSQTANTVKIKVSRYVNGEAVESKTIDIGTVRVSDLPN